MDEFISEIMKLGVQLDKATLQIEMSIIINDAQVLYTNHLKQLKIK